MPRLELAGEIVEDFERIFSHLEQYDVSNVPGRIHEMVEAISVLEHNPLIGRPAPGDLRELVIGRDARGYVALYRYIPEIDTVFVLAIRSQREAGYKRP